jgi:hypothetical protein
MVVVVSGRLGISVSFCVGWSESYVFLLLVAGVWVRLLAALCGGLGWFFGMVSGGLCWFSWLFVEVLGLISRWF